MNVDAELKKEWEELQRRNEQHGMDNTPFQTVQLVFDLVEFNFKLTKLSAELNEK
jgi:hypothetical protein